VDLESGLALNGTTGGAGREYQTAEWSTAPPLQTGLIDNYVLPGGLLVLLSANRRLSPILDWTDPERFWPYWRFDPLLSPTAREDLKVLPRFSAPMMSPGPHTTSRRGLHGERLRPRDYSLQDFEEQQKEQKSNDAHPTPDLSVVHGAECKTGKVGYADGGEYRGSLSRCHDTKVRV
jgi:hypothetical protein